MPRAFRSSIARPTDASVYASVATSRWRLQGSSQDGSAVLLSCRPLSFPTTCRFITTHSGLPVILKESGNDEHSCANFTISNTALPIGRVVIR